MSGKLIIIGFGPGSVKHFTERAKEGIAESDCILGYKTYVDLIEDLITDQEIISTGMSEEVARAQAAVRLAEEGRKVAVISSGDAGVYGMAGLIYEVLAEKGWKAENGVEVEVIPGISAINSCASLLGAPVMHDSCTISLSDHLTPWEIIAKRVESAAFADFVIALYNPKSGRRTRQIEEAQKILLKYREPNTPVGLVKSAYRERESVVVTTLGEMLEHEIGMLSTVIIGNSSTFIYEGKIITPRGYQRKYSLDTEEQRLKLHERLQKENEPWALHGGKNNETTLSIAEEALNKLNKQVATNFENIFEVAVSPGVANKNFTPQQMMTLAEVVGDNGTIQYSTDHQIHLTIPTSDPDEIIEKLRNSGLSLSPVGDVLTVKACDFCDGEKKDAIPIAEELHKKLGGIDLPKELKLGINGCGMACYGAVKEDIGLVHRQGKFDLFIGAKPVGRTAHAGQIVEEGIEPSKVVKIIEEIINEYKEKGHPGERFFKFFKRVKAVRGYGYKDFTPKMEIAAAPCGD
ncbi:precorrin-3B C(17)-methyltransferase [Schinkia azotoformans]|uniref:precorrin-3B C(17)-methyltransferase n=1 Tax=Schinkia azotoformans TaxID=1454 RepID=UPI002DBE28E3|nr:precorrin-3B C(17)-methyltransferase [Schinkia azotoformans]MEC1721560.1 precorrin-3B C(17)-methyltransferase [Schinkia azotoformans]MED4413641.1 precorrin-3B C(17)-methyltransferase [Schinkia azotoformans]